MSGDIIQTTIWQKESAIVNANSILYQQLTNSYESEEGCNSKLIVIPIRKSCCKRWILAEGEIEWDSYGVWPDFKGTNRGMWWWSCCRPSRTLWRWLCLDLFVCLPFYFLVLYWINWNDLVWNQHFLDILAVLQIGVPLLTSWSDTRPTNPY